MKSYEILLVDGKLEIQGLPEGSALFEYSSPTSKRLIRIRIAQKQLLEARGYLERMLDHKSDPLMLEVLASAAANNYASCFQRGDLSPKMDAKQVFGFDAEALARHEDWMEFRHKRLHHLDRIGREIEYCVVLDRDENFVDGIAIGLDVPLGQNNDWMQLLHQLIHSALGYLDIAAEKSFQKIKSEVGALSSGELSALPPLVLKKPQY